MNDRLRSKGDSFDSSCFQNACRGDNLVPTALPIVSERIKTLFRSQWTSPIRFSLKWIALKTPHSDTAGIHSTSNFRANIGPFSVPVKFGLIITNYWKIKRLMQFRWIWWLWAAQNRYKPSSEHVKSNPRCPGVCLSEFSRRRYADTLIFPLFELSFNL